MIHHEILPNTSRLHVNKIDQKSQFYNNFIIIQGIMRKKFIYIVSKQTFN